MKLENRFTVPVAREEAWKVLLDVERIAPCMPGARLLSRDGDAFTGEVKVKLGPINLTYGGRAEFVSLDEQAGVAVIRGSGKETRGTGTAKATITCRLVDQGASTDVEVDTDLAVTGKPASFGRGVLADVSSKLVDQFAACLAEEIREGSQTAPMSSSVPGTTPLSGPESGGSPSAVDQEADVPFGPPPTSGLDIALAETLAHPHSSGGAGAGDPVPAGTPLPRGDSAESAPPVTTAVPTAPAPAPATAPTSTTPAAPGGGASPRPARAGNEPIDLLGTVGAPVLKRLAPYVGALLVLRFLLRRLRR